MLVRSLSSGDTLYSLNADKLLLPSSTMKVITLAAAADRLGWDYTFDTRVSAAGTIDGGVLDGDLIITGSGDPSIDNWDGDATRLFHEWADALKTASIRRISGRIVGDDRAFDGEALGAGWMWDDLDRSFAAGVSALQFNENTAQITVLPGAAVLGDERIRLTFAPASAELHRAQPGEDRAARAGDRGGGRDLERRLRGSDARGPRRAISRLAPLRSCRNVAVVNPTRYFVNELRSGPDRRRD